MIYKRSLVLCFLLIKGFVGNTVEEIRCLMITIPGGIDKHWKRQFYALTDIKLLLKCLWINRSV
jgi:hypothetical protein